MSHPQNDKINDFKQEQEATVTLPRPALEFLLLNYPELDQETAYQINEALKAMKLNDELSPISSPILIKRNEDGELTYA
jgi:hypothetical protein